MPKKPSAIADWNVPAAEAHLARADPIMRDLIGRYGPCTLTERYHDPFEQLVIAIINQLISYQAADAVEARVRERVPHFTPAAFAGVGVEELRAAGLSRPKARYILAAAAETREGRLDFAALTALSDEDILQTLKKFPGIGQWTAQMVLLFGFKRPDVLAPGDAGLRRATRNLYGAEATLAERRPHWTPYGSVASWYLWRTLHKS